MKIVRFIILVALLYIWIYCLIDVPISLKYQYEDEISSYMSLDLFYLLYKIFIWLFAIGIVLYSVRYIFFKQKIDLIRGKSNN